MSTDSKEVRSVNTSLDWLMVLLRIRKPKIDLNPEWSKKTEEERTALKEAKKTSGGLLRQTKAVIVEPKVSELLAQKRLIVNLHNLKKEPNFKTTHSFLVANETEATEVVTSGIHFPKEEVKTVYYDCKKFNKY